MGDGLFSGCGRGSIVPDFSLVAVRAFRPLNKLVGSSVLGFWGRHGWYRF